MSEYPVVFSTIHTTEFKKIFDILKDIVRDINIHWTPEGIFFASRKQDKSIIVRLGLTKEKILEGSGKYSADTSVITGIDIKIFKKYISQIGKNDALEIRVNNDVISIILRNEAKNYKNKMLYNVKKTMNENDLLLTHSWSEIEDIFTFNDIRAGDFAGYIKMSGNISNIITLVGTQEKLLLQTDDDLLGFSEIEIENKNNSIVMKEGITLVSHKYSLKSLDMFSKVNNLSDFISISFARSKLQPSGWCFFVEHIRIPNLGFMDLYLIPENR